MRFLPLSTARMRLGASGAHVPHHVAHHIVTSPHARIDAPHKLALSIQIGRDTATLVKGARSFGRCLSALAHFASQLTLARNVCKLHEKSTILATIRAKPICRL